jgi:uncharacterized damage-inducible protein DinB
MALQDEWAKIVASSLDWEQAHATFENALKDLPADLRGRRPDNFPHSVWELVDHIRATQHDLLEFCRNPAYEEMKWPDDYWPKSPAPANERAWTESVASVRRDTDEFKQFAVEHASTLGEKIPHGTGQTYLRTIIVAVDHTSYHVGQIVAVRRLLSAWYAS